MSNTNFDQFSQDPGAEIQFVQNLIKTYKERIAELQDLELQIVKSINQDHTIKIMG